MIRALELSRGTNSSVTIAFSIDGNEYTMQAGDKLSLNVKTKENYDNQIDTITLNKTVIGTNIILLLPSDTQDLISTNYVYDITFLQSTGAIYKVVDPSPFILKGIVDNDSGTDLGMQEKTVSATAVLQEVTADSGYIGLSKVSVNAVLLQEKTATPIATAQNILPDTGYNLSKVVISASSKIDYYDKVTNNGAYFYNVFNSNSLVIAPDIDTSNGTQFTYMFRYCEDLTTVPAYDLTKATATGGMFDGCVSLVNLPTSFNTIADTSMAEMFQDCEKLTSIPNLVTTNVSNMNAMFYGCDLVVTIPQINMNKVVVDNNSLYMFRNCAKLVNIDLINLGTNLSLSDSPLLSHDSLMNVINGAKTVTGKTLTLGATNLAKLSVEEKAIATNKGWTLA